MPSKERVRKEITKALKNAGKLADAEEVLFTYTYMQKYVFNIGFYSNAKDAKTTRLRRTQLSQTEKDEVFLSFDRRPINK